MDPNLNRDLNKPVRKKVPLPKTSPPEMPANCRFKQGQIVRLKVEYGDALEGSIGIVDWYLPKKYDQEGVCWARFYDTFSLDLMTDEEPKSPGIIELVHQDDLELCTSLPSWLPYELDKKTGGPSSFEE